MLLIPHVGYVNNNLDILMSEEHESYSHRSFRSSFGMLFVDGYPSV